MYLSPVIKGAVKVSKMLLDLDFSFGFLNCGRLCTLTSFTVYTGVLNPCSDCHCNKTFLSCFPQLEFGVVYSCIEDKMYTARKGKGAFCNGQLLNVSDQKGSVVSSASASIVLYNTSITMSL